MVWLVLGMRSSLSVNSSVEELNVAESDQLEWVIILRRYAGHRYGLAGIDDPFAGLRLQFGQRRMLEASQEIIIKLCGAEYRFVISGVNYNFVMFGKTHGDARTCPKACPGDVGITDRRSAITVYALKTRVADGTRTRNNQNHNLGLYH